MTTPEQELRELDSEIAQLIFGYKWFLFDQHFCQLEIPAEWQMRHGGRSVDHPRDDDEIYLGSVPHYSTDPAAAMEVLKKVAEYFEGFGTDFSIHKTSKGYSLCCDETNPKRYATLEESICRFAKALFSKEPK